jgi:hypothetical protein
VTRNRQLPVHERGNVKIDLRFATMMNALGLPLRDARCARCAERCGDGGAGVHQIEGIAAAGVRGHRWTPQRRYGDAPRSLRQ